MTPDEIRDILEKSGFTQYESAVYLTLVEHGTLSAVEAARESDIPKSRIYDILENLEDRELIETYEQDSLRARSLEPTAVVDLLNEQATSLSETADEIEELWERPEVDTNEVTLVKRFETVLTRTRDLIRNADNEIHLALTPTQFEYLSPVLREARDRDIFVKVVLTHPGTGATESFGQFDYNFEALTNLASYRDLQTPFVALIDRSHICFAPQPETGYQFGIVADAQPLAYVFHWHFISTLWREHNSIHSDRTDKLPTTYVNIRQCIVELAPLLQENATFDVTLRGYDTSTNKHHTLQGRIIDLEYPGDQNSGSPSLAELSGKVSIYIDDGDTVWSVGGHYAKLEDIELQRLTVHDIHYSESTTST